MKRPFTQLAEHSRANGNRLNPESWLQLSYWISENEVIDAETFSPWAEVLLSSMPIPHDDIQLKLLAERASKLGLHALCLEVFKVMVQWKIIVKEPLGSILDEDYSDESDHRIRADLISYSDHWAVATTWEEHLRDHLDVLAGPLLSAAIHDLERRHDAWVNFQMADDTYDSDCGRRSAIEPHAQDSSRSVVDVLIDAARDCLESLANTRVSECLSTCQRLIKSPSPLIRRIAIHVYGGLERESADEKLLWLLSNGDIHDISARHEIFMFLQKTFPCALEEAQKAVVDRVLAWEAPEDDERCEEHTDFGFLHWLNECCPGCDMVSEPLKKISDKYPDLQVSSHPDLLHWIGEIGRAKEISPWSKEELLAKAAADWVDDLLSFKDSEMSDINERGLKRVVSEVVREDTEWGLDLAEELEKRKEWESYLWRGLFAAWVQWPDDKSTAERVLACLSDERSSLSHVHLVLNSLSAFLEGDAKPYAIELLPKLNSLAERLFDRLEQSKLEVHYHEDWVTTAINNPTGKLAEYFTQSLSLWINQDGYTHVGRFPKQYAAWFNHVAASDTQVSGCARAEITRQLPFFLYADRDWCVKQLIPLFGSENSDVFAQVWHGFLFGGRLTPDIFDVLGDAFLAATARMHADFGEQRRNFVEYYTGCCMYHVENPLDDWIPKFFQVAEADDIASFSDTIAKFLDRFDEAERLRCWDAWLKSHWQSRLNNIPVPPEEGEMRAMLSWVVRLPEVFPDAVFLATQMPKPRLEFSGTMSRLEESELPERHPEEVGSFLLYLLKCEANVYYYQGIEKLVSRILEAGISSELVRKLHEAFVENGLDDSVFPG